MKNKETIKKIYLACEDDIYEYLQKSTEYMEAYKQREETGKKLEKSINKDVWKEYDDLLCAQNELEGIENEEAFIKGFKTAYDLYRDTL